MTRDGRPKFVHISLKSKEMCRVSPAVAAVAVTVWSSLTASLSAQTPTAAATAQDGEVGPPVTVCGQQAQPRAMPPAGSGPVVLFIAPCFEAQGNASVIEPQTYIFYIQLKASRPSEGVWVPYDDAVLSTI